MKIKKIKYNNLIIANTFLKRAIGLLLYKTLDENQGMLFYNTTQIHTFFMRFSIDVIFCNKAGQVFAIYKNLRPFRVTKSYSRSYQGLVLEFKAGYVDINNLEIGDYLSINGHFLP
ncbi:MAG: DUF192 domain-containing protein [bacterium]|nr:DUF192 domain-containing protein [bacterium]